MGRETLFGDLYHGKVNRVALNVSSVISKLPRPCVLQAGAEISTVHPEQYAKRFWEFISNIFA